MADLISAQRLDCIVNIPPLYGGIFTICNPIKSFTPKKRPRREFVDKLILLCYTLYREILREIR